MTSVSLRIHKERKKYQRIQKGKVSVFGKGVEEVLDNSKEVGRILAPEKTLEEIIVQSLQKHIEKHVKRFPLNTGKQFHAAEMTLAQLPRGCAVSFLEISRSCLDVVLGVPAGAGDGPGGPRGPYQPQPCWDSVLL